MTTKAPAQGGRGQARPLRPVVNRRSWTAARANAVCVAGALVAMAGALLALRSGYLAGYLMFTRTGGVAQAVGLSPMPYIAGTVIGVGVGAAGVIVCAWGARLDRRPDNDEEAAYLEAIRERQETRRHRSPGW